MKQFKNGLIFDNRKKASGEQLRDGFLFDSISDCNNQFILLSTLCLLFVLGGTGTIVMWFTSIFDNAIFSNLAIVNNTPSYDMWRKPSPHPYLKIYIFNYTNVEEYSQNIDDKLNVTELGPYVYEESLERVNVHFNGSYVSYQEYRDYKFLPELSGGKQNDQVNVPNIPFFAAAAASKHTPFFTRFTFSNLVLTPYEVKPFIKKSAHRFIYGYEDNFYSLAKNILKLKNQKVYDKFGLLSSKIGVQDDVITINTGQKDINKINLIVNYNGKNTLEHWSTNECNRLTSSTDGSMYSPKTIRSKKPVEFFQKEMCRTMPLKFEKEVHLFNGKIPAYRYVLPLNVYDSADNYPKNQCYCNLDSDQCPQQGLFNVTPCAFGAPIFISFPHFYNADRKLKESINGLNLDFKDYKTYADLHPTMGFVMSGKTRFQFNIQVIKSYGISQLDYLEDNLMLPIAWVEMGLEDKTLPEDMVHIIFQTTITVKIVENTLKYGCLFTVFVTMIVIAIILRNRWEKNQKLEETEMKTEKNVETIQV